MGKVTRVAKGPAQVLVGAIAQGDVALEAAQRDAQETVTDDRIQGGASDPAAFLDAGLDFDVFLVTAL